MPKPRLYHHFLRARITIDMRRAIQQYAKEGSLRWGEAIREILIRGLTEQGYWPFKPLGKGDD